MKSVKTLAAGLLLTGTLTACLFEDKDSYEKTPPGEYVLVVTSAGQNATDYVMTAARLDSGIISARGRGIEQTGWRYTGAFNGNFVSIGYYDDNNFIAYKKHPTDSSKVVEKGRFIFPVTLDILGGVDSTRMVAIEIPRQGIVSRKIFNINLSTIGIVDTARTPIYENLADSLGAQPTSAVVRDGKLFISFYQIHARGDFSTPNTDTAFVAVYSYPGLVFEKVIKDPRSGPFGMYGNSNGLIKVANGDIYGYTCASRACYNTDTTVTHSKILRIANGMTTFDAGYEFDFQAVTGGKKLTWFAPIGGNLAIGRAMSATTKELAGQKDTTIEWVALGFSVSQDLYIIDLQAKTATLVTGVPTHQGEYGTSVFVENGFAYMNITNPGSAYIYKIDIAAKTGVQGAKVNGAGIKMIAK